MTIYNSPISQTFDSFSRLEKPAVTLCNPDHSELYSLDACYDIQVKLKWNAQSEIEFKFPRYVNNIELEAYDYIEGKRIVLVSNIGYFIIDDIQEDFDGIVPIKTIKCLSQESELVFKKITLFSGTYKLYDPNYTSGSLNLIGSVLSLAPNWSLRTVDTSASALYRTFNVSDTNVYQFLTTDVSTAYGVIFLFDYMTKTISVISSDRQPNETDILLSFDNLLQSTNYEEITNEITTVMYPYGGGNLTIRNVNPLGTNAIYNFTYYKNTDWMTQSLIDAVTAWELKVDNARSGYKALLVDLTNDQMVLLTLNAELAELEATLASDQQVRAVRVQQGLDTTEIDAKIAQDYQDISNKNVEISAVNSSIAITTGSLVAINDDLAFDNTNNFSAAEYLELANFMYESTYKNDNIIITDSMTYEEIQDQSTQLYNSASAVLAKAGIPRYQIKVNSVNFLALKEYLPFINQLVLGDQIVVDTGKGYFINATLLEYDFSYDNLDQFEIILSNRNRIDDSSFIFTDLFGQNIRGSTDILFNQTNWNDWSTNKPNVINNVIVPDGTIQYGLVAENLKGTIEAKNDLAIKNTNVTTGSSNFSLDQYGVTLRDATLISGSNQGVNGVITTAGGGTLLFSRGVYIGGTGLAGSGILYTREDKSGTTGSQIDLSQTFLANSTRVLLNGLYQRVGYNYYELSNVRSIIMLDQPLIDDILEIEYIPLI